MKIQFNTDKTVNGDERQQSFFYNQIEKELDDFKSRITRIEVHISDENGKKEGHNDIRCLIEARLEGKQPIVVVCLADQVEQAVSGAIEKLKVSLSTITGRLSNHL